MSEIEHESVDAINKLYHRCAMLYCDICHENVIPNMSESDTLISFKIGTLAQLSSSKWRTLDGAKDLHMPFSSFEEADFELTCRGY